METISYSNGFVFDLDGTISNTEPIWIEVLGEALAMKGFDDGYDFVSHMHFGRSWLDMFADIKAKFPGGYETPDEMKQVSEPMFYERAARKDIIFPDARRLMAHLAEHDAPMTVVSGSTRSQILRQMESAGMGERITEVISCDDISRGKPDPEGYLKGCTLLGLAPESCIAIEDKDVGVRAAKAAGMRCCLVVRPGFPPQPDCSPDWTVASLNEFQKMIRA